MSKISSAVDKILEGKDVTEVLTESSEITPNILDKIKQFADDQFTVAGETGEQDGMVSVESDGQGIIDPWMDHSGRFPLDDVGAVKEYGLDTVLSFCLLALDKM